MFEGLLPIGTVVLIGNSKKKVMIIGVCQKSIGETEKFWDYTGVVFPEGFIAADKMVLFNNDQISKIYAIGYQDEEQMAFKEKADEIIKQLREE